MGIATLNDYRDNNSDDGEEGGKPQEWFTGGTSSGTNVRDPNKMVDDLLSAARNSPNPGLPPQDEAPADTWGSGMKLGDEVMSSAAVPGSSPQQTQKKKNITVTFWKNGFSVDDGPLRLMDDPQNQQFIQDVTNGDVPLELHSMMQGANGPLHVALEVKQDEVYKAPPVKTFGGSANTLGSSPVVESRHVGGTVAPIILDPSLKSGAIQVRLPDGKRIVIKANEHHTIADVALAIQFERPDIQSVTLQTAAPPRRTLDNAQTVKEAGILGAAVMMR
eukprot:TRINITY_DN4627_c0_g1_i2.p1 TRINITY_DN4627_c0_g1~~TRINITY_DN4627_c0_g1_i2.p1  ORF type:complete len:276 (-),score=53.36 TRINITY_DN4627_c0_g1_i2:64-891(-)